jgi:hypothetical protein
MTIGLENFQSKDKEVGVLYATNQYTNSRSFRRY